MKVGCVLMAAGVGSRFGENKLLFSVNGKPLLQWALDALPPSLFDRAVAVVSDPQVAALSEKAGYIPLLNPDPSRGQGTTVSLGAAAMDGMDAALFAVADQPFLTQRSVYRVLAAYQPGRIVSLSFEGKRGNPVLFPGDLLPALFALLPQETGKRIINRHIGRLLLVEAESARELHDIDRRTDL